MKENPAINTPPRAFPIRMSQPPESVAILQFEAPGEVPEFVDWVRVRDWLASSQQVTFGEAFEYPTFDWYVDVTAEVSGRRCTARLWWSDYPNELVILGSTPADTPMIESIKASLMREQPDLGDLRAMDGNNWQDWIVSRGAPDYRKPRPSLSHRIVSHIQGLLGRLKGRLPRGHS